MANSVLPEELMICILTRLPVKTIVRFKSVCKPWHHLFSTPEFQKMHQGQFSSDPENQSFILHSYDPKQQFSIFNIDSGEKMPTIFDHPFAPAEKTYFYTVGCCNGLVCIRRGHEIILWNPAMKLSKTIPLKDYGHLDVPLGFGYDAIGDDFKVVMIVPNIHDGFQRDSKNYTSVEIYSANLDSWITIDVGFQFCLFNAKSDMTVNGNPYWTAQVDGNKVALCFDVLELVFKIVPYPIHDWMGLVKEAGTYITIELVDWNGALGALIVNYEFVCFSRVKYVWVCVFDDIERIWRNNHTFGPIEVDLYRVVHCSKNVKAVAILFAGTLFMLDLETARVKELFDSASLGNTFVVYGYTESLAHINGMEKVVAKY